MIKRPTWRCRDGRILFIDEMEASHIHSAIAMMQRNGYISARSFWSLCQYAGTAPDGAAMAVEEELGASLPSVAIDALESELGRRQAGRKNFPRIEARCDGSV